MTFARNKCFLDVHSMKQTDFFRLLPMDEHDVYWEPYGIQLSNHTDKAIELSKLKGIYSPRNILSPIKNDSD